jgi:hypothetical protein
MSEVQTALLGALRDLQHPGDDRTAVVRQTDAELHKPGVYHHGDASRRPLRRRLGGGPQAHFCRSPADFGGSGCDAYDGSDFVSANDQTDNVMKLGIVLPYSGADMSSPIDRVLEAERLGFD